MVIAAPESGVLEGVAAKPGAGTDPAAFLAEQVTHAFQGVHPVEADPAADLSSHEEVLVTVDQPRGEVPSRSGKDLGAPVTVQDLGGAAHRHDDPVLDCERFGVREGRVEGPERGVDDSEVC